MARSKSINQLSLFDDPAPVPVAPRTEFRSTLSYRAGLLEQVVRDKWSLAHCEDLSEWEVEFFTNRISSYLEEITRIGDYSGYEPPAVGHVAQGL